MGAQVLIEEQIPLTLISNCFKKLSGEIQIGASTWWRKRLTKYKFT